jgi:hypothetical protein
MLLLYDAIGEESSLYRMTGLCSFLRQRTVERINRIRPSFVRERRLQSMYNMFIVIALIAVHCVVFDV